MCRNVYVEMNTCVQEADFDLGRRDFNVKLNGIFVGGTRCWCRLCRMSDLQVSDVRMRNKWNGIGSVVKGGILDSYIGFCSCCRRVLVRSKDVTGYVIKSPPTYVYVYDIVQKTSVL